MPLGAGPGVHCQSSGLLQRSTARHHWQSSTMTAVCSECSREAGRSHRTIWTYHTRFTWTTLAAGATPCRVQDSHTGVQSIEQFGASIPGQRLQLGQRQHSPTTFSHLPHLYCTEDKDMARWQIIRRRRPTSLEQFAGCTASRRGLRTVQSTTKDTFVWLIETAAPSDFCF